VRTLCLLLLCAAGVRAQDPFEIHVYEYEPLPLGTFTYEAHLNYVARGTVSYNGAVAPTQDQFHYSSEVTAGLTDNFRAAFVVLTARRPGSPLEYAGFRVLPHIYAPQRWRLPVNLGLVAEFSFAKAAYVDSPRQMELRPIIEKHIGRLQLDANPVFSHPMSGAAANPGWAFEPAGRVGWQASRTLTPSVEYYGSPREHLHAIVAGGDLRLSEHLTWSFGAGFGVTEAEHGITLKSHFEFEFGRRMP
jgi:hypothetical protein